MANRRFFIRFSCHNTVELTRFDSYAGCLHVPHIMLCYAFSNACCNVCCRISVLLVRRSARRESSQGRGVEPKNCAKSKDAKIDSSKMRWSNLRPFPAIPKRANESESEDSLFSRSSRQSHDGEELRHASLTARALAQ